MAEWVTPIASCKACGASWSLPKDKPHECAVGAASAERDEAVARAERAERERDECRSRDAKLHKRVRARIGQIEGKGYSMIEMAHDLERLATHPVWEQSEQAAVELEAAEDRAERAEALLERLADALEVASDDLYKAANQFEGMRLSQEAGHTVPISGNPAKFVEKAERARTVLAAARAALDGGGKTNSG